MLPTQRIYNEGIEKGIGKEKGEGRMEVEYAGRWFGTGHTVYRVQPGIGATTKRKVLKKYISLGFCFFLL